MIVAFGSKVVATCCFIMDFVVDPPGMAIPFGETDFVGVPAGMAIPFRATSLSAVP